VISYRTGYGTCLSRSARWSNINKKNRKWYPQRVNYSDQQKEQDQLQDRECFVIHIDDAADLPEGVFDLEAIEQLSKQLQAQ
jgi:hypothetical protein